MTLTADEGERRMKIEDIRSKNEKLGQYFYDNDTINIGTSPLILIIMVVHFLCLVLVYKLEKNDQ